MVQMVETKNFEQLHVTGILEVLLKDSLEKSNMADTSAEEQPDEMYAKKVVRRTRKVAKNVKIIDQTDHSCNKNSDDSSTPDYKC